MKTPKRFWTVALLSAALPLLAAITYEDGDGSSKEKAIIIKGATDEETGVRAEYSYLSKHFPGYKLKQQSLLGSKGHQYDALEIITADKEKKTVCFDITNFFGK